MDDSKVNRVPGSMVYPKKGTLNRMLFKVPLIWWRLGLGPILSHKALSGHKMLVLTSWGRKSKLPRHTMLSYTLFNDKVYVTSGWGAQADWYKNIVENPVVTVQVGRKTFTACAWRVTGKDEYMGVGQSLFESGGDTHFKSWLKSMEIADELQDLIDKSERVYFVGFDPAEGQGPSPLKVDLKWIWGVILLVSLGLWMLYR